MDDHGSVASTPDLRVERTTRWRFAAPIALVAAIFVVFMPALDAGLVRWDDDYILWNITQYQTVSKASLRWMFTTSYAGHFQPLTWLSYSLDWALWKRQVFGYHLTNVVIHALTALTFFFLVRRLLAEVNGGAPRRRSFAVVWSAFFAACVFSMHPLRAETVAWLAARSGLLAGLFYVVSVGLYVHYALGDRGDPSVRNEKSRWGAYVGSIVACVLSLLAKASAVTLPFVLLILDGYPLRRLGKGKMPNRWHLVFLEKVPFVVLAVAAASRAYVARREGGALQSLSEHDVAARAAQALYGLTFYLVKTVWPTRLGPLYEIPERDTLLGPMLWISVVVVLGVAVVSISLRRRWPALLAALAVYGVVLVPVLGFVQSGPQLVADRYSYVACLGFAVLAGGVVHALLRGRVWSRGGNGRALLAFVCFAVIAVLARATFVQANYWLAGHTLWARGVQISPQSAIVHTNFADALMRLGMLREAAEQYRIALRLDHRDPVALHHYGNLQKGMGHYDTAIRYYSRALSVDPYRPRACLDLAHTLARQGRPDVAIRVLHQGMTDNPEALDLPAYLAFLRASHPDDHVRNGEEAIRWALYVNRRNGGDHLPTLLTLSCALAEVGRFDDAIETAERAQSLAKARGDRQVAADVRRRLALFRRHLPFRFSADGPDPDRRRR
ncbi:MAG: tetratricopeptide repeat protein [Phycisphaerae bacterium]